MFEYSEKVRNLISRDIGNVIPDPFGVINKVEETLSCLLTNKFRECKSADFCCVVLQVNYPFEVFFALANCQRAEPVRADYRISIDRQIGYMRYYYFADVPDSAPRLLLPLSLLLSLLLPLSLT